MVSVTTVAKEAKVTDYSLYSTVAHKKKYSVHVFTDHGFFNTIRLDLESRECSQIVRLCISDNKIGFFFYQTYRSLKLLGYQT